LKRDSVWPAAPQVVAPQLIGWADEDTAHCIWKKQPETARELENAIAVLEAQELDCHRYAGSNPAILDRIRRTLCDYPMEPAFIGSPRAIALPFGIAGSQSDQTAATKAVLAEPSLDRGNL